MTHSSDRAPLGWWSGSEVRAVESPGDLAEPLARVTQPLFLVKNNGGVGLGYGGRATLGEQPSHEAVPLLAHAPACRPQDLGDAGFCRDHRLRFPYLAGAMANGISSAEMVESLGLAGMLGIFGAAGLSPGEVEDAIDHISTRLGDRPWGCNLISTPLEPELETAVVDLYLRRRVQLVSASAYLDLTLPVVRYRVVRG